MVFTSLNEIKIFYNQKISTLNNNFKKEYYRIYYSRLNFYSKRIYINKIINYFRRQINLMRENLIQEINSFNINNESSNNESSNNESSNNESSNTQDNSEPVILKKGLVIGCNYVGTKNALRGCIIDAINIKNMLLSKYNFNNVKVLTDESDDKPTRDVILNEMLNLLRNSNENDELFISFSGHGTYTYDQNNDEKDGKDELFVPLDLKCIRDDDFKNMIQTNLKKNVKLFILFDCCHSGSMLDLKYQYLDSTNYNNVSINSNSKETLGSVYMISGCMDSQTSADAYINNKFQGAMTWSLLDTLNKNSNLTWKDLVVKMRESLRNSKYTQVPQFSSGRELDLNSKFNL